MRTKRNVLRCTLTSILLSLLSLTPLSGATKEAADDKAATSPAAEGFVVAKLVSNAALLNVYFSRFETIEIRSLEPKGKKYSLFSRHAGAFFGPIQSTLTFGQKLPVGRYQIMKLSAQAGTMSTDADVEDALPPFEIAADSVTDLGVLVMQPIGKGQAVLFPVADPERTRGSLQRLEADTAWGDKPVVEWKPAQWAPQPFKFGDTDSGLGLVVDLMNMKIVADSRLGARARWDNAKTPQEFHSLAKSATVTLSAPAIAADGTMYFGSLLGQILRRSPEGIWSNVETGRLAEISAITLADDALIAGTEEGELIEIKGDSVTAIGRIADAGRVTDVRHWADGNWWVVTRQLGETTATNVYTGKSLTELPTAPGKTLSQPNWPGFWGPVKPFALPVAGKGKYFLSILDEVHTYDAGSSAWTDLPKQKNTPVLLANNDGSVLFSVRPGQVSADDGATWVAFKPKGTATALAFFDANTALAIFATDQLTWSGTQEIRSTTDGGKTWTRVNELPKSPCEIRTLRQNDAQKRLLCVFRDGNIYSTGMQGEWSLERAAF